MLKLTSPGVPAWAGCMRRWGPRRRHPPPRSAPPPCWRACCRARAGSQPGRATLAACSLARGRSELRDEHSPCSIGFYSIWQIFLHSLLTHPLYSPIWSAPVEAMVRRKFANRQSLMLIVQVKFNKEGLNASTENKNIDWNEWLVMLVKLK